MHMKTHFSSISSYRDLSWSNFLKLASLVFIALMVFFEYIYTILSIFFSIIVIRFYSTKISTIPKVSLFIISRLMEWPKVLYIFDLAHFREQLIHKKCARTKCRRFLVTISASFSSSPGFWYFKIQDFYSLQNYFVSIWKIYVSIGIQNRAYT